MKKKEKGERKMSTLTLREIEGRVRNNSIIRENLIESFERKLKKRNLNKGRVRPKHPTESRILSLFLKK
ncbi:hypothetical protein B1R38_06080 [Bacillus cereus]|uniref:hypothetical protein n=1 Tax=Bacillus cereus TaxID=1396 RepID=UPI000D641B07|nr:hypothetical protein [Bacillus cereus]PWE74350.1 hypothetical protein B1R38_06080 [Bacillus cereus]